MKKYIYLAGLMGAFLFSSCDDFLTVESPDQLNSENFWRDESDVESALAATYSQMYLMTYSGDQWSFPEVKWPVEAYREDVVAMGTDAMNYPNWVELYNFTYTNGNSQFSSMWESYYRGISFANQVIEKTEGMDESKIDQTLKNNYINEARFMRGYYHMQLLLNWREIIVRDKYLTDANELDKELSSREDAWTFIIDDLQAATALPEKYKYSGDNVGRATKGAAYAYLGFAYLTMAYETPEKEGEYLTAALNALNQVQGYELVSDFSSMFDGTNKNSDESIFELQFSMSSANGAVYRTQFHQWMACSELGGWDEILPSQTLMDEYMKEGTKSDGLYDNRLYETIYFQCPYFNDGTGKVLGGDFDDKFSDPTRKAFKKFLPSTPAEMEANYSAINVPLMRYANVLLMKAEILNKQGHPDQAIPLINDVRRVHGGMPAMTGTSQEAVQAQIEHERMIEFPLENYRWYDLRRWGKLTEALQAAGRSGFNESNNAFYPVPQTELNANQDL